MNKRNFRAAFSADDDNEGGADHSRGSSSLFQTQDVSTDPEMIKLLQELEAEHSQPGAETAEKSKDDPLPAAGLIKHRSQTTKNPSRYVDKLKECAQLREAEMEIVYEKNLIKQTETTPATMTFVTSGYKRRLAERQQAAQKLAQREKPFNLLAAQEPQVTNIHIDNRSDSVAAGGDDDGAKPVPAAGGAKPVPAAGGGEAAAAGGATAAAAGGATAAAAGGATTATGGATAGTTVGNNVVAGDVTSQDPDVSSDSDERDRAALIADARARYLARRSGR